MFWVILLYALFASLFGLSKTALQYSEPFFLIGSRFAVAGLILLSHQFIWNRKAFNITWAHIRPLLLLSFLSIYVTNVTEIWGIKHMPSAKVCLIYSLSPFLAALTAYFALREVMSLKKWIGLLIGFVGLIPIFMTGSFSEQLSGNFFGFVSFAELAVLTAVFCSVYGWILLKQLINQFHYSPLMANGISMLIGGSLALLHSYFSGEQWSPIPVSDFTSFLEYAITMCLISNIICYNLYGYLLKRYSATFMSFAGTITPLFASLFGWIFLGETITWHFYASMVIFSIGLTIFYQEELKREKITMESGIKATA